MEIRTYRAKSMPEALDMVRRELGPDAAVLQTRQLGTAIPRWLGGSTRIEVTASRCVNVPSRLPPSLRRTPPPAGSGTPRVPRADGQDFRRRFRDTLNGPSSPPHSLVEQFSRANQPTQGDLPDAIFKLYTELIDAEVGEDLAKELIDRLRRENAEHAEASEHAWKAQIARMIEDQIEVGGPISVTPGKRRLVALVGPTGVGKTTTIAKLAANFRLRERRRVGLITVDTYRIAAVEQLRTYADIIDLPMEVVATPREMREAVARMSDLDLVLMDTAGRSPRDDVKIQELKSMLGEAGADEVHLVLSCVASPTALVKTAQRFAQAGTTSLLLTKLDEATALGNLLPLMRSTRLPLSYVTNGQNVPDDIEPASRPNLARAILGTQR